MLIPFFLANRFSVVGNWFQLVFVFTGLHRTLNFKTKLYLVIPVYGFFGRHI